MTGATDHQPGKGRSRPRIQPGIPVLLAWLLLTCLLPGCKIFTGTSPDRPTITIRYILVRNGELPWVEGDKISRWLDQVREIYYAEVDFRFTKLYTIQLDEFYTKMLNRLKKEKSVKNYSDLELIDDVILRLKRYSIYELEKITPFPLSQYPFPYNYFANRIRDHFKKKLSMTLELFGVSKDVYLFPLSTSLFWEKILNLPSDYDMIITNEPVLNFGIKYENVDWESPYEIYTLEGLHSEKTGQFFISTTPWSMYTSFRRQIPPADYVASRDYYVSSIISHELAHAVFSADHVLTDGKSFMNPHRDNRRYLAETAVLDPPLIAEIQAWKHLENAKLLFSREEYFQARDEFLEAIKAKEDYLPAHEQLTALYHKMGNTEQAARHRVAVEKLRTARKFRDDASTEMIRHFVLANQLDHHAAKSIDEVISRYREVIKYGYLPISRYRHLAYLYLRSLERLCQIFLSYQRYRESIQCLGELISLRPDRSENYYQLGWSYLNQKDPKNAIRHFMKYLDIDPDGSYSSLAEMYILDLQEYIAPVDPHSGKGDT